MTDIVQVAERNGLKERETEAVKSGNKKKLFKLNMEVYSRENSVNEIKENSDQSPCSIIDKQCHELKQKNTGKTLTYARQPSECPLVEKDMTKNSTTVVTITNDYNSKDSGLSCETDIGKEQNQTIRKCCFIIQAFSTLITVLTLGLVLFLYYKVPQREAADIPEVIIGQSNHGPAVDADDRISGSFKLDQDYLLAHKVIRWREDEFSEIKPASEEPCLIVPVAGKYLVFSRFTFKLPPGNEKSVLTHRLILKSATTDSGKLQETVFKRQYVSVIEHKLKEDSELRKPSVFIQFFDLKAGDEVCTAVSNPELLYISTIDNDVNIIKI